MKPWFRDDDEMELFEKYLVPDLRVFEWGSGGSTVKYGSMVKKWISIEHDLNWYLNVKAKVTQNENVRVFRVDKFNDYKRYSRAISYWPKNYFDLVFVDGRARVACARNAHAHLKDDGYLILHDCKRERYREIFEMYEVVEIVNSLAVVQKFK